MDQKWCVGAISSPVCTSSHMLSMAAGVHETLEAFKPKKPFESRKK